MEIQHIFNLIDERQGELFELLGSFIKINSESSGNVGNEAALAEHLHTLCQKLGLESDLYSPLDLENFEKHPEYVPGHNLEKRYNVTARWKGKSDIDDLMLMGHIDTVKAGNLHNWSFDPFCGEVREGKVLGRGACDDKYALAVILFLIKLFKEEGFTPKKNVLFAAYCDEEYGGSHGALATVLRYPCPRIVNIDGMENELWHCATGGQDVQFSFHTKDSVESAENAARAIGVVLNVMDTFVQNRRKELEENPFYKGTSIPVNPVLYLEVRAGNDGNDLGDGKVVFEYFTDKTQEEIYTEFAELEKTLKKRLLPLGIVGDGFKPLCRFFHYVWCDPQSRDINDMLESFLIATGKAPLVCGSCLSDMSVISKYGSSRAFTIGISREFGEKGGAHQCDEYIDCDKLIDITKIIATYIFNTLR